MKVIYALSEKMTVEFEGSNQKQVFEELSSMSEVFGEQCCKACNSTDIRFQVRENDDNKYYELKCNACGARLSFGAHKKGDTLFPKRKDAEGNYSKTQGWIKYQKPS